MPAIQRHNTTALAALVALSCATAVGTAQAQDGHTHHGAAAAHAAHADPAPRTAPGLLGLDTEPAPLAARYRMTVTRAAGAAGQARTATQTWHFYRDAQRVAVLKAHTEDIWQRDPQGRLSFERVLHGDQRVIGYSAGELLTLGVQPAWGTLARFASPAELAALRVVSLQGRGTDARLLLAGQVGGEQLRVQWLPALQLPASLDRRSPGGLVTHLALLQHAAVAPAGWPTPGSRSADYLRLDAADFGDMEYDPVVRRAQAMDVQRGWRVAHGHD